MLDGCAVGISLCWGTVVLGALWGWGIVVLGGRQCGVGALWCCCMGHCGVGGFALWCWGILVLGHSGVGALWFWGTGAGWGMLRAGDPVVWALVVW